MGYNFQDITEKDGWERGYIEDIRLMLSDEQVIAYWMKSEKSYMMYALRIDFRNMWDGALGMCAAYTDSGENGKKICRSLPNASNCQDVPSLNRYSCRIY